MEHSTHDVAKVVILNISAFLLSFSNIEAILRVSVLMITGGYTLWKWYRDFTKKRSNEKTN